MINNLKTRKIYNTGHIMRNSSGHYDSLLIIIEGRRGEGKRGMGRQSGRLKWLETMRPDKESS